MQSRSRESALEEDDHLTINIIITAFDRGSWYKVVVHSPQGDNRTRSVNRSMSEVIENKRLDYLSYVYERPDARYSSDQRNWCIWKILFGDTLSNWWSNCSAAWRR